MRSLGAILLMVVAGSCHGGSQSPASSDWERLLETTLKEYARDGNAAKALAGVDEAIRLKPDAAGAHAARGGLLRALGRHSEALTSYDQAVKLEPGHLTARTARGLMRMELEQFAEAEADFAAIIEAAPGSPDGYLLRGWLERRTGRFSEAERDLAEARARDPGRWEAYHNAGVAALDSKRWGDAERNFEIALFFAPKAWTAWLGLARVRAATGKTERALEDIDRAAAARPGESSIPYAKAEILRALGRFAEAARAYDRALLLGAAPIMFVGRAQARAELGDLEGAEGDFAKALDLEPRLREAFVARARMRAALKRYDEAQEDFASALKLKATAETVRDLGRLHQERERWAAAVSCFESALKICTDEEMRAIIGRDLAGARAQKK